MKEEKLRSSEVQGLGGAGGAGVQGE